MKNKYYKSTKKNASILYHSLKNLVPQEVSFSLSWPGFSFASTITKIADFLLLSWSQAFSFLIVDIW